MAARRLLLSCLTAILGTVALAAPAAAAPPRVLTGTFQVTSYTPGPQEVVGNGAVVLSSYTNTSLTSGGLQSTAPSVEEARCVTLLRAGTIRCHGEIVFTGTVEGLDGTGTVTSRVHLSCDITTADCAGRTVVVSATGALAGLHGHTTFTSDLLTGAGEYTAYVVGG